MISINDDNDVDEDDDNDDDGQRDAESWNLLCDDIDKLTDKF